MTNPRSVNCFYYFSNKFSTYDLKGNQERHQLRHMARNEHSPDDLEKIAKDITEACDRLRAIAASMREIEMPHVLLHSATQLNLHIPEVIQWAEKSEVDAKAQLRSFVAGVESKVELRKRYNANQKIAAAKKPWKKAAKKKS